MSFRTECKEYFDGPFFKRVPSDDTFDGNGILYTSVYFNKLANRGELKHANDYAHLVSLYNKCVVEPGCINRGHDNLSVQKHDDYVGLARAAQILCPYIALQIVGYGRKHRWFYRNTQQKISIADWFSCHFWRMPGLVQHFKICAGENISFPERLWWTIGVLGTAYFGNASGFQLKNLMVDAYVESVLADHDPTTSMKASALCTWAVKKFHEKVKQKWGGMTGVYADYFGRAHVFAVWE